ncbi:hypothetical protein ACNA6I_23285 (plasmid) [Rossellomorea sp. FS2]|uniref:hypothetical protein n=1 Tax=Rossellomorea sp. FS2 TaxID=3391447 RepID=UPI003A4D3E7D
MKFITYPNISPKYKPKYNVIYSNEQRLSFELPELSWAHFKARNNDEPMTNRRKSYEIALEQMDKNMKKASDEVLTLIEAMEKLPDVYSFNENARRALQKIKGSMEVLANAEDYKVDKRRKSLVKIK